MSLNTKTYRAILVYFCFVLGWLLLFCFVSLLFGPPWDGGVTIKFVTIMTLAVTGTVGFFVALDRVKAGAKWGWCVWFFTCWMFGIYIFIEKSTPRSFLELSSVFSVLIEKLFAWTIIGLLPYLGVLLVRWLISFVSTGATQLAHPGAAAPMAGITCIACYAANQASASFCGKCGTALPKEDRCHHCNALCQPGQKFCHACGKPASAA